MVLALFFLAHPAHAADLDLDLVEQITHPELRGGQYLGKMVAGGGDLNGDGLADVLVAVPGYDSDRGELLLFLGDETATLAEAGSLAIAGAPEDLEFGRPSVVGDVNGDGYEDLLVSAEDADLDDASPGLAWLFMGSATGPEQAPSQEFTSPEAEDAADFGYAISGAGDLDGDGYDDVVIGAPRSDRWGSSSGAAYIYYGSATGLMLADAVELVPANGEKLDLFGWAVVGDVDVDGDGFSDVAISTTNYDSPEGSGSGAVYLYRGSAGGIDPDSYDVIETDPAVKHAFLGGDIAAGDLNGDGYGDLIATTEEDGDSTDEGSAYVFYGSATGVEIASAQRISANASHEYQQYGTTVASGVDLNGDGIDDLAIGSKRDSVDAEAEGAVYVYAGSITGVRLDTEVRLAAPEPQAGAAFSVDLDLVEDMDGDGVGEVLVGSYLWDDGYSHPGCAYLWSGACTVDLTWYEDADGDGFGSPDSTLEEGCVPPEGYTADATDCDDSDSDAHPGATEIDDDGIDQDCDGEDAEGSDDGGSDDGGTGDDGDSADGGGDEGGTSGDDGEGKGSCSQVALAGGVGWAWALAGAGLVRRRRR